MLKFFLFLIIFYYCVKFLFRLFLPFFVRNIFFKIQKDINKKTRRQENYKKYSNGETEFSYKKDKNIDPGGEYVDFEELNED